MSDVPVYSTPASASDQVNQVHPKKKTLRIALAMRGGVSMAVWIGGAVAELDVLRRAALGLEGCTCADEDLLGDCPSGSERGQRAHRYRRLLDHAGYEKVEFDILAGASAGGLNAVLFALAQTYGVAIDDITHDTWLRKGGIWDLIRNPGFGRVASVLKGDDRLLAVAGDAIEEISEKGTTEVTADARGTDLAKARAGTVTVELAATLLDDSQQPGIGNRGRFSFARRPGGLVSRYSTIPGLRPDGGDGLVVDHGDAVGNGSPTAEQRRMALAARASSSFPGAFEPAAVHSVAGAGAMGERRRNDGEPYTDGDGNSVPVVNMVGVFPFAREPEEIDVGGDQPTIQRLGRDCERFNIIDGGVFDNIPIDRALNAIKRSATADPSERRMIYLDPQPPGPVEPRVLPDDLRFDDDGRALPTRGAAGKQQWLRRRATQRLNGLNRDVEWLRVIRSGMRLKQRTETATDEVELITEYNAAAASLRSRLKGLAATMASSTATLDVPVAHYLRARVDADAQRFGGLALRPWDDLCARPVDARPYQAIGAEDSLQVTAWVRAAYDDMALPCDGANPVTDEARKVFGSGDVGAAMDATKVLISWVQQLERISLAGNDSRREVKAKLYRCLLVLAEARRLTIDELVYCTTRDTLNAQFAERSGIRAESTAISAVLPDDVLAKGLWPEKIIRGTALQGRLTMSAELTEALTSSRPGQADEFYVALAPQTTVAGSRQTHLLLNAVWALIAECHNELRRMVPSKAGTGIDDWQEWSSSVFAVLGEPKYGDVTPFDIARLFSMVGVPETSRKVGFHKITGDEPPLMARRGSGDVTERFSELRHDAIAQVLENWIRTDVDPGQITPEARTRQMNTAVGLSRADLKLAGTPLARFGGFLKADWRENDWYWGRLDAGAGIVRLLTNEAAPRLDEQIVAVEESILAEAPAEAIGIVGSASTESIMDLPGRYRHAVVSRLLPMALRGLWPDGKSGGKISTVASRVGLLALRPVAALLALAADPLRAIMAFAVVMCAAAWFGAGATPLWSQLIVVGVLLGGGGALIFRGWSASRRWKAVGEFITSPDRDRAKEDTCCADKDCWEGARTAAQPRGVRRSYGSMGAGVAMIVGGIAVLVVMLMQTWTAVPAGHHSFGRLLHARPEILGGSEVTVGICLAVIGLVLVMNSRALKVRRIGEQRAPVRLFRVVCYGVAAVLIAGSIVLSYLRVVTDWLPTGDDVTGTNAAVCAVAVAVLALISLWYWAQPVWVLGTTVVAAAAAVGLQWLAITAFGANGLLDLLPAAVWAVIVGGVLQYVQQREVVGVDAWPSTDGAGADTGARTAPQPTTSAAVDDRRAAEPTPVLAGSAAGISSLSR